MTRLSTVVQRITLCGVLVLAAGRVDASIILNGDFENNTAVATMFNLGNAAFTATVANATGFGTAQEIDLVTGLDFGIAPQSGNWKLGLHTQADPANFDAFSLNLSAPIVAGGAYNLSFYGAQFAGGGQLPAALEIGVSNAANSFGTLLFSGVPASADAWTFFNTLFVAPVGGAFLTVRTGNLPSSYAFIDNMSLVAVPEPVTLLLLGVGAAGYAARRRRTTPRS